MSPSNHIRRSFTDETNERTATRTAGLIVPFPDLDTQSRPSRRHTKRHHHANAATAPSAPISLPKSHIHRTPSELQLEQSLIQAEYSDHMMYARLVRGMTERGAALQQHPNQERGHELSRKSLMGVVECRQRPILEEGQHQDDDDEISGNVTSMAGELGKGQSAVDSGWSIGYSYEETSHQGAANSQERHLPMHSGSQTKSMTQEHGHCREVSSASSRCQEPEDEEDECVFSLEM